MVGLADDGALGAHPHMQAVEEVPDCDVSNFIRKAHRQTDMHAKDRMAKGWEAAAGGSGLPSHAIGGVKLECFADVMANGPRHQDIPVDHRLRIRKPKLVTD